MNNNIPNLDLTNNDQFTQFLNLINSNANGGSGTDLGVGGLPGGFDFGLPANNNSSGFGFNIGTANTLGSLVGGLSDLAGLYLGGKQFNLARDQQRDNRDFANRNIANQAKVINTSLSARFRAAQAAQGIDQNSPKAKESLAAFLDRSSVDGSPVGGG